MTREHYVLIARFMMKLLVYYAKNIDYLILFHLSNDSFFKDASFSDLHDADF
jgi:hypothetical protein